jgi:hypothetical protein
MCRITCFFFFVFCTRMAWSQMPAIDDTFSAKDRLSKYLLGADNSQDRIAVFYREQSAATKDSDPDLLVAHRNSGIFIQSTKHRLRYMSADFDSLGRGDTKIPFRYESFIINGKEKRRFYDCSLPRNNKTAKEVPLDPETGQRPKFDVALPGFWEMHSKEIEPFGLVIGDKISVQSRYSSLDRLIQTMLTDFSLESESESKPGVLTGKWRRGTYVREITFSDTQGGLPTLTKNYVVDSKGKPTSDHNCVLRCGWKEVASDRWVVENLSISFTGQGKSTEHQFEFVWCEEEKLNEFLNRDDFVSKHKFDDSDWHWSAYDLFFPESAKMKRRE